MDRLCQFFAREGRDPRSVLAAQGADLGDDDEIVAIRTQRLANDVIGDVRAIEVGGVDVVDSARNGLAQDGQRRAMILGRAEYAGSRELHGTIANTLHDAVAELKSAGFIDTGHDWISYRVYVMPC